MLRAKRRAISLEQREAAAESAAILLTTECLFQNSLQVGCYLASHEEFDCMPIIKFIWERQKNCYLPILSEKHLTFAQYRPDDTLRLNQYHILEPINTPIISIGQLDLVLVPLVGFDESGNRLGMGSGYYDRTFAFLLEKKEKKPLLIGLAYEAQRVDQLFTEAWDVPLAGVLTEQRLLFFSGR